MRTIDSLSPGQWESLQDLFDAALTGDAPERARLLEQVRSSDPQLAQSLASMLATHEKWSERTGEMRSDLGYLAEATTLLAKGDSIGPYRIVGVLGEGGMGVVYLAERADGEVTLTVAIKLARPGLLEGATRQRFLRERELLAGLNHPHITRLFDAGVNAAGQPYFVMEFVRGISVDRWCDAHRLDLRARLRLFLDVCLAVEYAHAQLVLHRDIKADNVLVDAAGVAKLIDFGIATPIRLDATQVEATAMSSRLFSPSNVAPEQLNGGPVGVACDIYQLGTLLYGLLCGRPVFDLEGRTLRTIEDTILHQAPVAPSARARRMDPACALARGLADPDALARRLAGDLDEIVLMALRKEPGRRYTSVRHLVEDIQRHLDLQPVRARGSHRGYRARLFVKRNWRALALGAAAALATVAFVSALVVQSRQLTIERDRAVAERQRAQAQQRRAEIQTERAEATTRFLVGVFKAADPRVAMRNATPIGEVLENGRLRLDTELEGHPELAADLSFALANIYDDIGDEAHALKYAQRALQEREALAPGTLPVADSLGLLATVERSAHDCPASVRDGARANALYRTLGIGPGRSVEMNLAIIDCERRAKGMLATRARARALLGDLLRDRQATPLQIATAEQQAAAYAGMVRDWKDGLPLLRSAIDRLERGTPKMPVEVLEAKLELAYALGQDEQFDPAIALFQSTADAFERIYGHDSLSYAFFLQSRGGTLENAGRIRDAEADFLEEKRIIDLKEPGVQPDQAAVAFSLAEFYEHARKDQPRAGRYFMEAVRISTQATGARTSPTPGYRFYFALWQAHVGRYRDAVGSFQALLPDVPIASELGIEVRLAMVAVLLRAGQPDASARLLAACEQAIAAHPEFDVPDIREGLARARKGELE